VPRGGAGAPPTCLRVTGDADGPRPQEARIVGRLRRRLVDLRYGRNAGCESRRWYLAHRLLRLTGVV
jgi:hypothetical protein